MRRVMFPLLILFVLSACAGPLVVPQNAAPAATPTVLAQAAPTWTPEASATSVPKTLAAQPANTHSPEATTASPTRGVVGSPTVAATPTPLPSPFRVRVEVVATGLQVPWALVFAPDGRLLFTERPGRIRMIQDGELLAEPVAELPVSAVSEGGLMGLALDPRFEQNGYLYVMYTYIGAGGARNRISRLTLEGQRAGQEMVLLDDLPGAPNHNGGRLKFGPDGKLYATVGETFQRNLAQQMDNLGGKILRLNTDGSVPEDNPFPGSPIYSLGHRNPQGLAWSETGALYSTEHGPSGEMGLCCRDELNRIEAGGNYGWPLRTTEEGDTQYRAPLLHSGNDTWAPSGLAVYTGTVLGPWQGNLFFGALRGTHLHRVVLGAEGQVQEHEQIYAREYGRIRDVIQGPDGYLYFSTSNRDGRGRPVAEDDRILRIVPGS